MNKTSKQIFLIFGAHFPVRGPFAQTILVHFAHFLVYVDRHFHWGLKIEPTVVS